MFLSLVVVAAVVLTFELSEMSQNERSSGGKNNSISFIIANLTIVTIVVMTITRSSNNVVL